MTRTTKRTVRRAGFTLIEMLMVVIIVGILLSLTAAAVLKFIGTQQTVNTQTELTRLQGDLIRAYRSAADKFRKEPIPSSGPPGSLSAIYYGPTGVLAMAGDSNRARVIWTKLRLKQTFPNNFAEAWNPSPMPALSYYQTKLTALGYRAINFPPNNTSYAPQSWESSVCLLWALQRGEDSTALNESDIGTGSLKDFTIPGSTNTTVKGLIDNWGTPLTFFRWPVYSVVVNPPPAPLLPPFPFPPINGGQPQKGDKNDADDPSGLLESYTWQTANGPLGNNLTVFQTWCHPLIQKASASAEPYTYRTFPLVVSSGPDRVLGLDGIVSTISSGYCTPLPPDAYGKGSADNIYPQLATPK